MLSKTVNGVNLPEKMSIDKSSLIKYSTLDTFCNDDTQNSIQ